MIPAQPRIADGPSRIQAEHHPMDEAASVRAVSMERWGGRTSLGNDNSVEKLAIIIRKKVRAVA